MCVCVCVCVFVCVCVCVRACAYMCTCMAITNSIASCVYYNKEYKEVSLNIGGCSSHTKLRMSL